MSPILDDMDSRPGSTTSLLRTVVGLYVRRLGGWISIADLIELMEKLDVPAPRTRTAVVRLKKKDLLVPKAVDRISGYEINPEALIMLGKGDRRIFNARNMKSNDPWCLISFSLPEELRHVRHQLRRHFYWIGCGMVSPALWICPDFLSDEVEDILVDLGIREYATVFRSERPRVASDLRDAVAEWWDLGELESLHREFISGAEPLVTDEQVTPEQAFARYITGVDMWRVIPYLDPGLPTDLLPSDWPGTTSTRLFDELSNRYAEQSWHYVSSVNAELTKADQ